MTTPEPFVAELACGCTTEIFSVEDEMQDGGERASCPNGHWNQRVVSVDDGWESACSPAVARRKR
jgi:hypothetical protein